MPRNCVPGLLLAVSSLFAGSGPAHAQERKAVVAVAAASRSDELLASEAWVRLQEAVVRDRRYQLLSLAPADGGSAAAEDAREASARKKLAEALKKYDRVDLRLALTLVEDARVELETLPIERSLPLHLQALFVQSLVNVANGRLPEARADLARVLALRPDYVFEPSRLTPMFQKHLQQVRDQVARLRPVSVPLSVEGTAAAVSVDGVRACTTPCELQGIVPGRHVITVDAPGHRRWQEWLTLTDGSKVFAKPVREPGSDVPAKLETLRAAWAEGESARGAAALASGGGADEAIVGRVRREGAVVLLSLGRVAKDGHVSARTVISLDQLRSADFPATVQQLLDKDLPRNGGRPVAELEGADVPPLSARKLTGRLLLGAGVAAAGGGVVLGLQARALATAAGKVPQDAPEEYARVAGQARSAALGTDVLYGVAGAALVTGLVLTLLPEPPAHLQPVAWAPLLMPSGAGVALAGEF